MTGEALLTGLEDKVEMSNLISRLTTPGMSAPYLMFLCARLRFAVPTVHPLRVAADHLELMALHCPDGAAARAIISSYCPTQYKNVVGDIRFAVYSSEASSVHTGVQAKLALDVTWHHPDAVRGKVSGGLFSLAEAAYRDRNADDSLDPVRLAVLADALEEDDFFACLPAQKARMARFLRGQATCSVCLGTGIYYPNVFPTWCPQCDGAGVVRASVPRYPGFWPLEILLGRLAERKDRHE